MNTQIDTDTDKEAQAEAMLQVHYYTLIPKHIKGIISEFKGFRFNTLMNEGYLNPAEK